MFVCVFFNQERDNSKRKLMAKARLFGIAMDYSATSKLALNWVIHNLVGEGDQIIIIHVASPKADPTNKQLFEDTGSRTN